MKKRILSIALCICMALTLLPTAALAEETAAPMAEPTTSTTTDGEAAAGGVAQIGDTTYATLPDAVAAANANAGSTIKLLANVTKPGDQWLNQSTTLDLNGFTLDFGSDLLIQTAGVLTIQDTSGGAAGKITSSAPYQTIEVDDSASVILNSGTVENTTGLYCILIDSETVTVNGGAILSTSGNGIGMTEPEARVVVTGGKITAKFTDILGYNANHAPADATAADDQYSVLITGGTLTSEEEYGVSVRDGSVKVTGGSITTNGAEQAAVHAKYALITGDNSNLTNTNGTALKLTAGGWGKVESGAISGANPVVLAQNPLTITGGTFSAKDNAVPELRLDPKGTGNKATISGGTFTNGLTLGESSGANTLTSVLAAGYCYHKDTATGDLVETSSFTASGDKLAVTVTGTVAVGACPHSYASGVCKYCGKAAPITSVTVSPKTASNQVGTTTQLTADVVVANDADPSVTWTSSDETKASVNANGLVTAVAAGTVTITATSTADSTKSDTATITVTSANSGSDSDSDSGSSSNSTTTDKVTEGSVTTETKVTETTKTDGSTVTKTEETKTDAATGSKTEAVTTQTKGKDGSITTAKSEVTTDAQGNKTAAATVATDATTGKLNVPVEVVNQVTAVPGSTLTAEIPGVSLAFDHAAIAAVIAAGGKAPSLSITPVSVKDLPAAAQEKLAGAVAYDFSVVGAKSVDFGNGIVTISLVYTKKDRGTRVSAYYVADNGSLTKMPNVKYTGSYVTIPTGHFSAYAIVEEEGLPFTDVADSVYYYDAVEWAVDKGVTSGTSATTFNPGGICTRAQTVALLWRAMGSPEPTTTANLFTDVSADAYYYKAVLWAVEKGITGGTGATTFSPDAVCSRSQVVTFLWRAEGSPAATTANPFADVSGDAYYANAVLWAVSEGITGGTGATTFAPAGNCSRAQIVTFLFRQLGK